MKADFLLFREHRAPYLKSLQTFVDQQQSIPMM